MPGDFDIRLRRYQPRGGALGPVPDLGFELSSSADGGALTAIVSQAIYGDLPSKSELAVEFWDATAQRWVEPRDARMWLQKSSADRTDVSSSKSLSGNPIVLKKLGNAVIGVEAYSIYPLQVAPALALHDVTVSGTMFTKNGHGLASSNRVRITDKDKAKRLRKSGVYYVTVVNANQFRLTSTATSAPLNCGTAAHVDMARLRDRVQGAAAVGHSFRENEKVGVLHADTNTGISDGTSYYIRNATPNTFGLATKPGGAPVELATDDDLRVYRDLDGSRVFRRPSATPGGIIRTLMSEAHARGWGDDISADFLTATDSNGVGWKAYADDDDTDGAIDISFPPSTTYRGALSTILGQGIAEMCTQGRMLHLFNAGTGVDWAATGHTFRRRLSGQVVTMQEDYDSGGRVTHGYIRGEDNVLIELHADDDPDLGRLEAWITASGAKSTATARGIGKTAMRAGATAIVQHTVTEWADQATWIPGRDFDRGDWVEVLPAGATAWSRRRVLGWMWRKDGKTGRVQVTTIISNRDDGSTP